MDSRLSAPDIIMLVEGLDALIPFREGMGARLSDEELERWEPYRNLRVRLKQAAHMSFYDDARGWLEAELRQERIALTDKLHSRLAACLEEPKATRRTVHEGFVAAIRELREARQSTPRPLS